MYICILTYLSWEFILLQRISRVLSLFIDTIFARACSKSCALEEFMFCRLHSAADAALEWTMVTRKPANDRHWRGNNFRGAITTAVGRVHAKQTRFSTHLCYLCCSSMTRHSSCIRAAIMALTWTSKLPLTSSRKSLRAFTKVKGKWRQ